MRTRILSVALAVVSLAVIAWFAIGIRQARDVDGATAIVSGATVPSPTQARRAAALLHSAKQLNPDTEVDVLRAELYLEQNNRAAARALLERVVSREPENAVAWEWLARASAGDLHEFYLAAFKLEQLVPAIPRRH